MRIAVLSDIHGNLHALEAVLADMDAQGVDRVYCLGDLVGYGAFPNEVIALIRERGIPTVMGNYDEGVGFDKDECGCAYTDPEMRRLGDLSLMWSRERVTAENKAFLRSLHPQIRFEAAGRRFLLVHGSPRKINEYLYESRPDHSFERLARASEADVLIFGHTHLPYAKEVAGVLFVNTGSVGKPKDGDVRSCYVLLDVRADGAVADFRRVAYDVAGAASAVRAGGLPARFAELLETARG
ncbi:MAG: metallophosphoesterase family protein [Dehalococcoidales bacterium]|nr:metallophosphoesterase family protein [Dehalococcoidales bacterium]